MVGCAPTCKADKTVSRWARYRARKKGRATFYLAPGASGSDIRATYAAAKPGDTIVVLPVNTEAA